mgnify:FL=1
MNKKRNAILIGAVCFILTLAIAIQMKTIKNSNLVVTETSENTELQNNAIKWKEKYEQTISELEKAEKSLNDIRTKATESNPEAIEKQENLIKNNTLLGQTDVNGPGVIVTLTDNEGTTNETIGITEDIRDYLVHDSNLREVIRKLKTSGAEAICVNDQRVVFSTAITCSGNVIRVNNQRIGSPFVIKAIGSPELLYGNLEPVIKELNDSGIIVKIEKKDNIEINKYNGIINQTYTKSTE